MKKILSIKLLLLLLCHIHTYHLLPNFETCEIEKYIDLIVTVIIFHENKIKILLFCVILFQESMFQETTAEIGPLTEAELAALEQQNLRPVTEFKAGKFGAECQKHWDIFYKRNTTKFFKDRHWTQREFAALARLDKDEEALEHGSGHERRRKKTVLLEVGCGVGNFVFPLIEEHGERLFAYACDFSPRAVEFVRGNPGYDEAKIRAFQCDIVKDSLADKLADSRQGTSERTLADKVKAVQLADSDENPVTDSDGVNDDKNLNDNCLDDTSLTDNSLNDSKNLADLVSLVFVLSAIHPRHFAHVCQNLNSAMATGGLILFRDYAVNDMAMIRFGAGTKISDRHYLRQDGTMSYFFTTEEMRDLMETAGFKVRELQYVHRKTVNVKEKVDANRIFVQGVFEKI